MSVLGGPMLIGMVFGRFGSMMFRMQRMAVCGVSMMRRLFVIAVLVVFGGSMVVLGRVFMVLRGFVMMFDVVFGHGILS
jgi:hypothetical protein